MEEDAKASMAAQQHHQQQQQHHHQQQAALQQQHQQAMQHQQQQHLLLLQQLQRQKQQQQQDVMTRFPSNIDAHLRPQLHHQQHFLHRPMVNNPQSHQMPNSNSTNPNPNPSSNQMMVQNQNQSSNHHQPNLNNNNNLANNNNSSTSNLLQQQQQQQQQLLQLQQQQQQKASRGSPAELQMAYQDAWRVCHPDFKRPFASIEDACERLLPYHVVADYEAEEDDKILDSDTTGQMLSRSQQWDHNIAAKVAEFTATFEKQVLAFNIISRKRGLGEFRTEEKLMMEQLLLQDERRTLMEVRAEMDSRQKMGRESHEANLRIAAMAHAEQSRAESQSHSEMMGRTPIRASAYVSQGNNIPTSHDMSEQGQEVNPEMMINGWGNNTQRDEKEPSEDFLNDEETENGDIGMQSDWHGGGELDLNSR